VSLSPTRLDACPYGSRFTYHRMDSIGSRIELVDVSKQAAFIDTWNPGGPRLSA